MISRYRCRSPRWRAKGNYAVTPDRSSRESHFWACDQARPEDETVGESHPNPDADVSWPGSFATEPYAGGEIETRESIARVAEPWIHPHQTSLGVQMEPYHAQQRYSVVLLRRRRLGRTREVGGLCNAEAAGDRHFQSGRGVVLGAETGRSWNELTRQSTREFLRPFPAAVIGFEEARMDLACRRREESTGRMQ